MVDGFSEMCWRILEGWRDFFTPQWVACVTLVHREIFDVLMESKIGVEVDYGSDMKGNQHYDQ